MAVDPSYPPRPTRGPRRRRRRADPSAAAGAVWIAIRPSASETPVVPGSVKSAVLNAGPPSKVSTSLTVIDEVSTAEVIRGTSVWTHHSVRPF